MPVVVGYEDVCMRCGILYPLARETDLVMMKEGHHLNCNEKGDHYHSRYAISLCPKCRGGDTVV